jgi:molybdate transport system substrate-binding protein
MAGMLPAAPDGCDMQALPYRDAWPGREQCASMPSLPSTRTLAAAAAIALMFTSSARAAEPLTVYAAGSLKAAFLEIAKDFESSPGGAPVTLVFGASGLLRDRLMAGEPAQVFASANMEHPQSLAAQGRAEAVQPFARNALCALAAPGFALGGASLVARLLDPAVKLGTSTPKADPSGDYAFALFDNVEARGHAPAGSAERLKAKALQLTGGPDAPKSVSDRNVYGMLVASGRADVFLTYCTNASLARRDEPQLQVLDVPADINVSARYGLAVLKPATEEARRFVAHLLGPQGQAALKTQGFAAPE